MSDIRALLLTDVVDSTRLSERLGDAAMAGVWAAHDRVARDLLPRWHGREIDKTDGMLLLFERADDAVRYALAYHAALAALPVPLQARAGLHVGPVILRENAPDDVARGAKPLEVDGLAKPTAARVMSLARGGQTLLTAEACAALQACGVDLPTQSHGHWVMKGVAAPVELFEVGPDAARFAAPPDGEKVYRVVRQGERWLPVKDIPNNLPWQPTSFIGREAELDEIKRLLLGRVRLLTLLGMGGLGKTRLSLQAAAETLAEFPDGVWFMDLAPLRDGALVVAEAAQVLGLREEIGRPLLQTVCAYLRQHRALFILDNCEHLLKPAAQFAYAVLRAAPHVRFVASSREALRVPGEQSYPIRPLPVPRPGDALAVLERSTAVRLFVERAQAHRIDFRLDEQEAPAVAALVARLEGIPLALELAAARVRHLGVAEINRRLADRYAELVDGDHVLDERQQTLRALVDWSYDMLDAAEQRLMASLSVFAGGFDVPAVQAVVGAVTAAEGATDAPAGAPAHVQALLTSLAEKSLIGPVADAGPGPSEAASDAASESAFQSASQSPSRVAAEAGSAAVAADAGDACEADSAAPPPRWRMLETLRDYAAERLAQRGQAVARAASARHCEHFFALAKAARDGIQGPRQAWWIGRMEVDHDNLRAGLAAALAGAADPILAVKIPVAMQTFWRLRGYVSEGRAAVRAALALPAVQASPQAQAHALYVGAAMAASQSDHAEAQRLLAECLALRRAGGQEVEVAATLSTLALARLQGGDAAGAVASETEALQIFERLGDRRGETIGHLHLASFHARQGARGAAREHLDAALALARALRHREFEAECAHQLGLWSLDGGDAAGARRWLGDALAVSGAAGNRRGHAEALLALARCDLAQGQGEAAAARLAQAVQALRDLEMRAPLLQALECVARWCGDRGRPAQALALWDAVARLRVELALPADALAADAAGGLGRDAGPHCAPALAAWRQAAGEAAADAAAGRQAGWTLVQAAEEAVQALQTVPAAPPV